MNNKKVSKELMGASSISLTLSILEHSDTFGFDIIKKVKILSEGKLLWKEGSIYPVLKRLDEKKLIDSYWVMDEGRPRKYYKITNSGKKELKKHKKEWILLDNIFRQLWKNNG